MDEGTFAMPEIQSPIGQVFPAMHSSEPASRRWIAVATDMRFHPLVGCGGNPIKPADPSRGAWSRYEAWQDLICEASWKSRQVVNKGKTIVLERGELMAARSWLAKRWNWSEKQARGFIEKLEAEFMIKSEGKCCEIGTDPKLVQQNGLPVVRTKAQQKGQQKQNLVKVISICNYDIYQTAKELSALLAGQQKDEHQVQPTGQQKGQQRASKGPESYLEDTRVIPDNKKNAQAHASKPANPSAQASGRRWEERDPFGLNRWQAGHHDDVKFDDEFRIEVHNGFESELLKTLSPCGIDLREALDEAARWIPRAAPPAELKIAVRSQITRQVREAKERAELRASKVATAVKVSRPPDMPPRVFRNELRAKFQAGELAADVLHAHGVKPGAELAYE